MKGIKVSKVSYAVVGASRGIGLEFVRQLAGRPDSIVFAIVRNKAGSIHLNAAVANLKNVHVVEADVVNHASLERAAKEVAAVTGGKLDVLIHNAARMGNDTVMFGFSDCPSMDALDADLIDAFKINTLGVVHSVAAFLPLLRRGTAKKVAVISTDGAVPSIVYAANLVGMVAYGTTKAATAMVTTKWALQLKDEGFVVVSLTPGIVDTTDTIGPHGDPVQKAMLQKIAEENPLFKLETPAQSVEKQLKVIDGLKPSDNGAIVSHHTAA